LIWFIIQKIFHSEKREVEKMNNEELKIKIQKEETDIQILKEKRAKLDNRIKAKTEKLNKYKSELSENEIKEFKENLRKSGMSFDELHQAIAKGDMSEIQAKLSGVNL